MLSAQTDKVNSSLVLKGEATAIAERVYRGKSKVLFPGVDKGMYAEANKSLAEMGGSYALDKSYLDGFFWDTLVVRGYLPGVKHSRKSGSFSYMPEQGVRESISKFFGCSVTVKKSENLPRSSDGLVGFKLTLKTDKLAPDMLFSLLEQLKFGKLYVAGYQLWLENVDATFNVPGHVKAGFMEGAASLKLVNGVVLVPEESEKAVGLQCPMWGKDGYQFKVYNKLTFMAICTAANNDGQGGSQLHNILNSGMPNIHKAFRDKAIQEHGFARAELRFSSNALPGSLEDAKAMLWAAAVEVAKTRVTSLSLDKMVSKYLPKNHKELVVIQELSAGGFKVVVVRWMDMVTGRFNSQSTASAKVKVLPQTLQEAVHLAYQWVNGISPTVAVVVSSGGAVEHCLELKPTGRTAAIKWDTRVEAESRSCPKGGRGISFEEVGMPSFWMEHPKKRLAVAVEHSSGWWEQGKELELGAVETKQQREYRERSWAVAQNRQAKLLLERLAKAGGDGGKLGEVKSLSLAPKGAFLVVKVGVAGRFKDAAMLGADGQTYRMSQKMVQAGWDKWQASPEVPLVVVLGKADKTKQGKKWYPGAVVYQWCRESARLVDKGLEALFYSDTDYTQYGDMVM